MPVSKGSFCGNLEICHWGMHTETAHYIIASAKRSYKSCRTKRLPISTSSQLLEKMTNATLKITNVGMKKCKMFVISTNI